jgi:arsenite-transporting ATPase
VESWLARRVVFFGGKGGVGKTTCAAAFALLAARRGRRTLLVSTDPAHSTTDVLEVPLGPEERQVAPGLSAVEIDPQREADAYIERVRAHLGRVAPPHLRAEMDRQVELARVSPGAEEAALFDRMAAMVEALGERHDLVVFDTAPTGHTLRLLALPELLQAWVDGLLERRRDVVRLSAMWRGMTVGRGGEEVPDDPVEAILLARRRTFFRLREVLLDAGRTAFVFVVLPERLPILETDRAVAVLRRHGVPVGGLIVNRLLPEEAGDHPFLVARRSQEAAHLAAIDTTFADLPRIRLPLLAGDVTGREDLERVAAALAAG